MNWKWPYKPLSFLCFIFCIFILFRTPRSAVIGGADCSMRSIPGSWLGYPTNQVCHSFLQVFLNWRQAIWEGYNSDMFICWSLKVSKEARICTPCHLLKVECVAHPKGDWTIAPITLYLQSSLQQHFWSVSINHREGFCVQVLASSVLHFSRATALIPDLFGSGAALTFPSETTPILNMREN